MGVFGPLPPPGDTCGRRAYTRGGRSPANPERRTHACNAIPTTPAVVLFKHHVLLKNDAKSLAEGREIHDDVEMCEIRFPGAKDWQGLSGDRALDPVDHAIPTRARKSRSPTPSAFSTSTSSSRRRSAQTKSGTPLDYAPFLTEARRAELRAQNVYTVEQLAAIDGAGAEEPRPGRTRVQEQRRGVHRREQGQRAEPADGGRA